MSKTTKISGKVNKSAVQRQKEQDEALTQVLANPALKAIYEKEKKRSLENETNSIELWWERGVDVVDMVRGANGDSDRAAYGEAAIPKLAAALGMEARVFYRAKEFVSVFEENRNKQTKFFTSLKKTYGAMPSWTHVEEALKQIKPSKRENAVECVQEALTMAAEHQLSVREFRDQLKIQYAPKKAKRKLDAFAALKQLEGFVTATNETLKTRAELLKDTIGTDLSEITDPVNMLQRLQNLNTGWMTLEQQVMDQQASINQLITRFRARINEIRVAEQQQEAAAAASAPAQDSEEETTEPATTVESDEFAQDPSEVVTP